MIVTRLQSLPKLRECLIDARAFAVVSGDREPERLIAAAIAVAERYEPPESFKDCLNCGQKHQRRSDYCSFGCAEEDGAIEK